MSFGISSGSFLDWPACWVAFFLPFTPFIVRRWRAWSGEPSYYRAFSSASPYQHIYGTWQPDMRQSRNRWEKRGSSIFRDVVCVLRDFVWVWQEMCGFRDVLCWFSGMLCTNCTSSTFLQFFVHFKFYGTWQPDMRQSLARNRWEKRGSSIFRDVCVFYDGFGKKFIMLVFRNFLHKLYIFNFSALVCAFSKILKYIFNFSALVCAFSKILKYITSLPGFWKKMCTRNAMSNWARFLFP